MSYADDALEALELRTEHGNHRATVFALLDVAAAIREHKARPPAETPAIALDRAVRNATRPPRWPLPGEPGYISPKDPS